jgi:16S rRNA (cytosine967-C5)-methyltransferase
MIAGAQVAAAIEVLADIEAKRRPAVDALKDWGHAHRFAGSKDRGAIASFVYDALRRKASAAFVMEAATPRAILLGTQRLVRALRLDEVEALFNGIGHAPGPLTEDEAQRYVSGDLEAAPPHIAGDFPEWLEPSLLAVFGDNVVAECAALATRAPVDLRVNTSKIERAAALTRLARLGAEPTPFSPIGIRIPPAPDGRALALAGEPVFVKGLVEVQDEGSQLAALLSGAAPGEQVLDLCAGAGGKSLALSALMENRGQIYATDADARRLMQSQARIERAQARNLQLRPPRGGADVLADLEARCDLVFVDAPCTGTGSWRRNPDAKWRIRPGALAQRIAEQDAVLAAAKRFVKPGGRLHYVTCSVLREENEERIEKFLSESSDFSIVSVAAMVQPAGLTSLENFAAPFGFGLRLGPLASRTDGFFVAQLKRA